MVKKDSKDAVLRIEEFWFPLLIDVICIAEWFRTDHYVFLIIGFSVWILMGFGIIHAYERSKELKINHRHRRKHVKSISKATDTVKSRNPITRTFSRMKIREAIEIADITTNDIILDFGCGDGWLKESNPHLNITGYDINKEQTEVNDYRKLKPTKIMLIDVIEHIKPKDIKKIIQDFKHMNKRFSMVLTIPKRNLLSRVFRVIVGKTLTVKDHITSNDDIFAILHREFSMINCSTFYGITYIVRCEWEEC